MSVNSLRACFIERFIMAIGRSVVDVANSINVPVVDGALRFRRSKQAAVRTSLHVNYIAFCNQ